MMIKSVLGVAVFIAGMVPALAGATNGLGFFALSVPTIDEVGLLGLTVVVAIAGAIAARRRKRK
jgi:hypothetical protein